MTTEAPPGTGQRTNPYVGPQSFHYGQALYGRTRETTKLLDLLIAERIVLLYSPSGAGKTSLIEAALRPSLEAEEFEVLPVVRLNREPVPGALPNRPRNRYVMSTLLSLEGGVPTGRRSLEQLDEMTIADYMDAWPDLDGRPGNEVLFFDQFEEILADPVDHHVKEQFFLELGEALRDRHLWALFAMREDFLAGLDPFLRLVPTRFASRFRLDALTVDQALQAMTQPAHEDGVDFTEAAATRLVDDLRRVRVQRADGVSLEYGRFVEPVQLQVVCRRLWERLDPDATEVTVTDVEAVGDVDRALADYYAECVAAAAAASGVPERALRDWAEDVLITPQGFRAQVLEGPRDSQEALRALTRTHLLRAEDRRGAIWYELVHDRLIDPIRSDNSRWREEHLGAFERQALLWDSQGRPDGLLVPVPGLLDAQQVAATPHSPLTTVEQDFLRAYARLNDEQEREARTARRTRKLLIVAVVGLVASLVAGAVAVGFWGSSQRNAIAVERTAIVGQGFKILTQDEQVSLLLGLEAAARGDGGLSDDERSLFLQALAASPPSRVVGSLEANSQAAEFTADGSHVVLADTNGIHVWSRDEELTATTSEWGFGVSASVGAGVVAWLDGDGAGVWTWQNPASDATPVLIDAPDVLDVQVAADGTGIVLASEGAVRITSAAGEDVHPPLAGRDVFAISASSDLSRVAVASSAGVQLWDPASGTTESVPTQGDVTAVELSDDGSLLAVADGSGLSAWDVSPLTQHWLDRESLGVVDLAFDAAGSTLAVAKFARRVSLIEAGGEAGGTIAWDFPIGVVYPDGLDFDPRDPGLLLVYELYEPTLIVDVGQGHKDLVTGVAVAGDGRIATASYDGTALLWPATEGAPIVLSAPDAAPLMYLAFATDSAALVTGGEDGVARVWDTATGSEILAVDVGSPVQVVAVGSDGTFATGTQYGQVAVWRLDTGEPVCRFGRRSESNSIHRLAFDGTSRLLVADTDGNATLLEAGTCKALKAFRTSANPQARASEGPRQEEAQDASDDRPADNDATIDASGRWVATADSTGVVRLWDVEQLDGEPRVLLADADVQVLELAFNAEGTALAAAQGAREVLVWDVAEGEQRPSVELPAAAFVERIAWAGTSRLALPLSSWTRPTVLPLDDTDLLELVRERTHRKLTIEECQQYTPDEECVTPTDDPDESEV